MAGALLLRFLGAAAAELLTVAAVVDVVVEVLVVVPWTLSASMGWVVAVAVVVDGERAMVG